MSFSLPRALIFGAVALPVGFILAAFALAALGRPIAAPAIAPWALGLSVVAALVGGLWQPGRDDEA